jgi:CRISPR-associated protein Csd2
MKILSNRLDLLYFFDCQDGNPNGDPDAGNMPRVDPETMQGLVSDVCQKRKVRDYVYWRNLVDGKPKDGFNIFFGHAGLPMPDSRVPSLNSQIDEEVIASIPDEKRKEKLRAKDKATVDEEKKHVHSAAAAELCKTRFDIRTFGAVMSTGLNAGQVRGPVQCTFARSLSPILPLETTITRGTVTREEDLVSKDREMGKKNLIPYGLYRSHWFISPQLANQTKFSTDDLGVLLQSLLGMWELDRSAARGTMTARQLIVFKHQCAFGNARAQSLFDLVENHIKKPSTAPRAFSDYVFPSMDDLKTKLPTGVEAFSLTDDATIQAFIQTLS